MLDKEKEYCLSVQITLEDSKSSFSMIYIFEKNLSTVSFNNLEEARKEFFTLMDKIHLQFAAIRGSLKQGEENATSGSK